MSVDRVTQWRQDLPDPKNIGAMDIVRWLLILLVGFISVAPFAYAFMISIRPRSEVFGPLHFFPHEPTIEPWLLFFSDASKYLLNSVMVATGVALITLVISIPGAYAFARLEFGHRKKLFYTIVMIVLVPPVMLVVPVSQIIHWIHLFDTIMGVWLAVMIGYIPLSMWILRDNFMKLPPNTEEAAQVYGCTQFQAFRRVVLPLAAPAILTVAFLTFLHGWREFLFTNMLTTPQNAWTGIIVLFDMLNPDYATNWPMTMAGSFILALPPVIFYGVVRRYLERSMAL